MRKVLPFLGASLTALAMVWSASARAQDQFKDLDPKHWAYEAVTELQQKGIVLGYPGGYFKGKRTLTRYEFAIALKRALDYVATNAPAGKQGEKGDTGAAGPPGEAGAPGPAGMTPDEVEALRKLTDEFKDELKSLGASVKDINNRLDALARDLAAVNSRLDKMIQWHGKLFFGERTDLSRYAFTDYSGAARINPNTANGGSNTLFGAANVLNDVVLGAKGNLGGGVKANVDLDVSNYLNYRGNTYSTDAIAGAPLNRNGASTSQETIMPYNANIEVPLGGPKSSTVLTIGRYGQQVTALTYSRPNLDAYFDVPWLNDGNYVQDGFRLKAKLGSVDTKIWVASFGSVVDSTGMAINQPLFGAADAATLNRGVAPAGIDIFGDQVAANQTMGLSLGLPVFSLGQLGFNLIYLTANTNVNQLYNSELVYDANFKLNPLGRLNAYAEWAKSVTSFDISKGDGQSNDANNAYVVNLSYGSGPVDVKAGYNYIDPNYSAPGAWDKIGSWYNPTNVQGPYVRLGYKFNNAIDLHLGGDFLTGARNRAFLTTHDNIERATGGIAYKLNKTVGLSADYEGDFFRFSGANKPMEQYITLGAQANLSSNTVLKLAYQVLSYNQYTAVNNFGTTSNANVLTTQVAVHF